VSEHAARRPVNLGLDTLRPAVVTIDLHRGHLDPSCATLPLGADAAERVVEANKRFLAHARALGVPVVHVVTSYLDVAEIASNPFWRSIADTAVTRGNILRHNLEGSPGLELMPGLYHPGYDRLVRTKKRYNCFLATDLDLLLRNSLGANTLLITGVNTNSCVLATTIAAQTMDYAAIVVEECVDTCDGPDFHRMALEIIRRAFGWVMTGEQALRVVTGQELAAALA
jgi:nicotinamidase-related amidase